MKTTSIIILLLIIHCSLHSQETKSDVVEELYGTWVGKFIHNNGEVLFTIIIGKSEIQKYVCAMIENTGPMEGGHSPIRLKYIKLAMENDNIIAFSYDYAGFGNNRIVMTLVGKNIKGVIAGIVTRDGNIDSKFILKKITVNMINETAQQGDAPEPATNATSASQPSILPAR